LISINKKHDCTGCYACYNACPTQSVSMERDKEGFLYPEVDLDTCIDCDLCKQVCSLLHLKYVNNNPVAYACHNTDEKIRLESSSGGIFTLIAERIINNNGVVFGAVFDDDFNVFHSCVTEKDKLWAFRGSKYVQSKIGLTYSQAKEFLQQGRQVLFSGTPCQIGGLKSYMGRDYDNLFCVDIVCHGVPSPKVWQKYVSYREQCARSSARRIAFRRKDEGWKRYSVSFLFKNDTEYRQTFHKDLYMRAFLKNVCLRPSCYVCRFKSLHRQSDITLADFWGIQMILPEMDDDKGTSLVFVNSDKGRLMLEQIRRKMVCKKVDINEAVFYNLAAVKSVPYNPKREKFFAELDELPFDELVRKYCADSLGARLKGKVKSGVVLMLRKMGMLDMVKRLASKVRV